MDFTIKEPDNSKEVKLRAPDMVYRDSWGALPPTKEDYIVLPASDVLFTFTGGRECHSRKECVEVLQELQRHDMEQRGLPDIQYNFLVGGDEEVYEGRGWLVNATKDPIHADLDGKSIDIAYIGDFKHKFPTDEVLYAGANFLKYLLEFGFLKENFELTPLGKIQGIESEDPTVEKKEQKVYHYGCVREKDDVLGGGEDDTIL